MPRTSAHDLDADMPLMSGRLARIVLTVALLVATQVASASQLCHAVMAGGMPQTSSMDVAADAQPAGTLLEGAAPPCCDGPAPRQACVDGQDIAIAIMAPLFSHGSDVAVFAAAPLVLPRIMVARARALLPMARSAGPPSPVYILFRRFLS